MAKKNTFIFLQLFRSATLNGIFLVNTFWAKFQKHGLTAVDCRLSKMDFVQSRTFDIFSKPGSPAESVERSSKRGRERHAEAPPTILKTPSRAKAQTLLMPFVPLEPQFRLYTAYVERQWPRLDNKSDKSRWAVFISTAESSSQTSIQIFPIPSIPTQYHL